MQFANIEWRQDSEHNGLCQPYSLDFNDVYFNSDNGLQETEYVFIEHNQLKQRFSTLTNDTFCIAETGFGSGLNFLAVATHWLALAPKTAKLRFISIEKHPFHPADFFYAFNLWPQIPQVSSVIIAQYDNLKIISSCICILATWLRCCQIYQY
jgi:tRNA 5-methylaminomethyl-2-thiouridine biosynthesis bifunctional protein